VSTGSRIRSGDRSYRSFRFARPGFLRAQVFRKGPTGHKERHSPQEMQSPALVAAIRAAKPFPAMSMADLPDTSRQAR